MPDVTLNEREAQMLCDLLQFHAPHGGGSPERALAHKIGEAVGVGCGDLGRVNEALIREHIDVNEGDVYASIGQMAKQYLDVAAKGQ